MESLLAQSFTDFEVLAVDDGSTDDTAERLQAWASRDGRIRVLRQGPEGIVVALERARGAARGRYLARMDGDDVAHPDRFARQIALMRDQPSLAGCGCLVRYFPRAEVRAGARRYESWLNRAVAPEAIEAAMFVECPLAHPTFFLRARDVAAVGGYRDVGWAEDYDLVLRMWRAGGCFGKVPEVLLDWREGTVRLSRTHPRYAPEAFRRCRVHHLLHAFPEARDGVVVWGAGPVGKALSRALTEQGGRVRGFAEVSPRKIGQRIHGATVLDSDGALGIEGVLHLGAVGQEGVRGELRAILSGAGLTEMRDFVMMA
jgi:hypothetical protein